MSTICLAAQRSYTTGEAVWFSYRLPSLKNIFGKTALWLVGLCAMLVVGLYMHIYWNLRHPALNRSTPALQNRKRSFRICITYT